MSLRYYEAKIEEITTDGQVSVKFVGYEKPEVTTLVSLKLSNSAGGEAGSSTSGVVNKKEMLAKQKEYLKKRKQKKQDRMKKLEQVCTFLSRGEPLFIWF